MTAPDMYMPESDDLPYHAWMYPLGVVYARTLDEADEFAAEHGMGNRSEMWW